MVIDRPWAIVYGPKSELGVGLMYGLGITRKDAWSNACLVYRGHSLSETGLAEDIADLKKRGMIARRVVVSTEDR